ncbi:MAG: hypothetical protein QXP58_04340 [Thermoprotei archaeon]
MSNITEEVEDTLRELYSMYNLAKSSIARLCLAWDIIELYLARATNSHDWDSELKYASRSSVLNSLFKVLCMDAHFRRSLESIGGITPMVVGDEHVEFKPPINVSQLIWVAKLVRDSIFISNVDQSVLAQLVGVVNEALKPLIKELVPCE